MPGFDDLAIHHDAPLHGLDPVCRERRVLAPSQPRVGHQQDLELRHHRCVSSAAARPRAWTDPSGQRAGVDRQRAGCDAHCLERGWEVVEVFCDNDASACGPKPRRPASRC
jgi:hypothetical protein